MSAPFFLARFPESRDLEAFDALVAAALALSRSEVAIIARLDDFLSPAVLRFGVRLLGSRALVELVCSSLADGPAGAGLVEACDVLYDQGLLDLGSDAVCVLKLRGFR